MPKNWMNIKVKTEPAKMKFIKGQIRGYPEFAMRKYYFQLLQMIIAQAVDAGRFYMRGDRSLWTPTGIERVASGRGTWKGRSETDDMAKAFKQSKGRKDGGKYVFDFGWLDGKPGYAIFQEQGTKNGIRAMHAIELVTNEIRKELRLYDTPSKAYRAVRNAHWKLED